ALFSVAGLVVPALGGLLALQLGWRAAFVLGAVAAAIGLAAVQLFTIASGAARSVGQSDPPAQPTGAGPQPPALPSVDGHADASLLARWTALRVGGRVL